jgi:hypothetical protein
MKAVRTVCAALAVICALAVAANAADDKPVTLKGTITCAKCDLKETKTCLNVIQVKDGDKTVTYYFEPDSSKKFHKAVCTEAKKGSVTGTVVEKDGKKIITATEVKFD